MEKREEGVGTREDNTAVQAEWNNGSHKPAKLRSTGLAHFDFCLVPLILALGLEEILRGWMLAIKNLQTDGDLLQQLQETHTVF